jgi:hypothetical protein
MCDAYTGNDIFNNFLLITAMFCHTMAWKDDFCSVIHSENTCSA